MKILNLKVDPKEQWANMPQLEVTVDKFPDSDSLLYEIKKLGTSTYYWAEKEGYVSFFVHDPRDESGFGGHIFSITLKNGEKVKVRGPWSSRSSVINYFFPHSMECVYYYDEKGSHGAGGHVLISKIEPLIEKFEPNWFLFGYNKGTEIRYDLFPIETKEKLIMVKDFQELLDSLLQAERYFINAGNYLKILNSYMSKKMTTGLSVTKPGVPTIQLFNEDHDFDVTIPLETIKIPIVFDIRDRGLDVVIQSERGTLTLEFEDLYVKKRETIGRKIVYAITEEEYEKKIRKFVKRHEKYFKLIE